MSWLLPLVPVQAGACLGVVRWVVLIFCAASIALALIVGRDPAIRAYKEAKARGEEVTQERVPAMSE